MKAIRQWRNILALLFAANILLTGYFALRRVPEAAVAFGAACAAALVCLVRQRGRLNDARLIYDNRIFSVPAAVITTSFCANEKILEETVVSTFGLLLGSKVFKWGCDGVTGSRLKNIEIDRERVRLSFGSGDEALCIELLHGLTDRKAVMEVTQKLWHETGIQASISGWSCVSEIIADWSQ